MGDCMHNIHPIYNIKELMIRRELAKDENLRNENWTRFLPQFKQRAAKKKKKSKAIDAKKSSTFNPFPPEQTPRKVDDQLASGEYFLSQDAKKKQQQAEVAVKQQEV